MTAPAQHIGQAGCGAGLARARCHDQQIAPEALRNMGADSPDGVFLVIAVGDFIVNFNGKDGLPLAVIEAKRSTKDPNIGRKQAQLYADCLEQKFGRRPMLFNTNGYTTYAFRPR